MQESLHEQCDRDGVRGELLAYPLAQANDPVEVGDANSAFVLEIPTLLAHDLPRAPQRRSRQASGGRCRRAVCGGEVASRPRG